MPVIQDLRTKAGRPLVMGIVNVTPDSFYEQSRAAGAEAALDQARRMVDQGADILDIGGESTRPGSEPVPVEEELERVVPVVEAVSEELGAPISVDTRKAEVAKASLAAGASIINDVSAGRDDPKILEVCLQAQADLVLMHMQGRPKTMQKEPFYENVVAQVTDFLIQRAGEAEDQGLPQQAITVDPGLGFGKRIEDNLALLRATSTLSELGYPLLIGASRKSMFDHLLGRPVEDRLAGSLAVAAYCAAQGADVLRVHDVQQTRDVVDTLQAIEEAT